MAEEVVHRDIFDIVIAPGKAVVTSFRKGDLRVCVVEYCTPKMIRVRAVNSKTTKLKYPHDMLVVEDENVSAYIIRNAQ